MVYARRRYRRQAGFHRRRPYRRYATRRPRFPRYRSRTGRRTGTSSRLVKLTLDSTWTFGAAAVGANPQQWNAFRFVPTSIPGFSDYATTFSHFRIVKANLYISRTIGDDAGTLNNYLVVGSRPFATTARPTTGTGVSADSLVPPQLETALRQTRWQRVQYPSTTTQRVRVGFKPYTMLSAYGPAQVAGTNLYQRVYEGRRWMPFTWASPPPAGALASGLLFWGPYMVVDRAAGDGELPGDAAGIRANCTLELYCQFKGQI